MKLTSLQYYLDQYTLGTISKEEWNELQTLLKDPESSSLIQEIMDNHVHDTNDEEFDYPVVTENVLLAVLAEINKGSFGENQVVKPAHRIHFLKTTWFRYAAAVILIFGAVAYFRITNKRTEQSLVTGNKRLQTDVAPGRDRAILTLANGQQIILDSTQGNIVKQGSLTVVNLAGKLKYQGVGTNAEYNTISTPKGGQYQIVLPDGSKVWLNAASSIKFPTAFKDNERNVEMTGEAYMEIARNPKQSFVVTANGVEIQVLGTSFNVNAYQDESAVKTTLISGSVKVISGMNSSVSNKSNRTSSAAVVSSDQQLKAKAVILKPGQQCSVVDDQLPMVNNADIAQALAWKNGEFQLDNTNLTETMRQLARWYDVEVVYEKEVPDIKLGGKMPRDLTLSQMLDGLGELGVRFRMEGKRLVVMQ